MGNAQRRYAWCAVGAVGVLCALVGAAVFAREQGTTDERRVALLIGNAAYQQSGARLANPLNDVRDMAEVLRDLGFEVTELTDATWVEMQRAVRTFLRQVGAGSTDAAVFYYSGHGIEMNGQNYLAPVDFSAEYDQFEARDRSLRADLVHRQIAAAGARVHIMILDACRNNPFEGMRSLTRGGLASQQAPRGGLVAFAAAQGEMASDNPQGRNGLYTKHLVETLREQPGLPAGSLLSQVRRAVLEESGGEQAPTYQASGGDEFVFRVVVERPSEVVFWESIVDSGNPADFQAYLTQWPEGTFARLANNRLTDLGDSAFWNSIADSGNPADFETYLAQWPDGRYARLAGNRLANLRESEFWAAIANSGNPADFEAYLDQWPRGRYSRVAGNRLADLRESRFWEGIADSRNPADFEAYLDQWPAGRYTRLAANRLADLQESGFWAAIANSGNPADFEAYLDQWPAGRYAPLARSRLTALIDPRLIAEPETTVEREARVAEPAAAEPGPESPALEAELSRVEADPPARESESPRVQFNPPADGRAGAAAAPDPPAFDAAPSPVDRDPPAAGPVRPPDEPAVAVLSADLHSYEPGAVWRDCADCPAMVVLPAGEFQMGWTEGQADERPVHRVRIGMFALGRHEVTRGEYAAFVTATGHASEGCNVVDDRGALDWKADTSWNDPDLAAGDQDDRHPVVCVGWADAQAYARWLSDRTGARYRLPSEAEWEYAVRAATAAETYWEGDDGAVQCAYANGGDGTLFRDLEGWLLPVARCADGAVRTALVGSFAPNGFGLYDMLGNVWEWMADCWHEDYEGAPTDGSAWMSSGQCGRRIWRGGSWETAPIGIRAANRYWSDDRASSIAGFRVARELRR